MLSKRVDTAVPPWQTKTMHYIGQGQAFPRANRSSSHFQNTDFSPYDHVTSICKTPKLRTFSLYAAICYNANGHTKQFKYHFYKKDLPRSSFIKHPLSVRKCAQTSSKAIKTMDRRDTDLPLSPGLTMIMTTTMYLM